LRWDDFDFKQRNVRVARAVVRGKTKASTKTCLVRDVELSERAWSAFEVQRAITQLVGRQVFWNPATKAPWADIQSQWKIWARCLRRLGFRLWRRERDSNPCTSRGYRVKARAKKYPMTP